MGICTAATLSLSLSLAMSITLQGFAPRQSHARQQEGSMNNASINTVHFCRAAHFISLSKWADHFMAAAYSTPEKA